ncbi:MAG: DUF4249 domain-containing protein [Ekhidna sp.]|nr:DUF4249 domain-containing protein [Ekhidna sp.]
MKKILAYVLMSALLSCEEVVIIELPSAQNLITIESWLSSLNETQTVRVSQSTGFSEELQVRPVTNAEVVIQSRLGIILRFSHTNNGIYASNSMFAGEVGQEYRLRISIENEPELRSDWERMEDQVAINNLTLVNSFEENDPDNAGEQFTIFFPKVLRRDPAESENYYRWVFYKDRMKYTEPESITVQDDRLFNGSLIPNDFRAFGYNEEQEIIVELQSITKGAYNFLSLLKEQITSLGTSNGTTPANIMGNISFQSDEVNDLVLGYFGTVAISRDTVIARP